MQPHNPSNEDIADVLERVAALLQAQDANPYRVNAYRRAARVVERSEEPIAERVDLVDDMRLEDLPDIGTSIAGSIREFVHTGRLRLLERLEGQVSPEDLFTTVPGIGEELAHRIHSKLHIETLEGLELAAHDGRLETVRGVGERRVKGIRDSIAAILSRSSRRRARRLRHLETGESAATDVGPTTRPSIAAILAVDEEYRKKAEAQELKTIAPRRFNPEGTSWLPIFHTEREDWHFTALFSNTARAHDLGKTRDWVVVYFERDGHENQCTVVTEHQGPLKGCRVIRGHERECLEYYKQRGSLTELRIGLTGEKDIVVEAKDLAGHTGNLGADVLSTHRIVLLMEQAARAAIEGCLPDGTITVGTAIRMRHFAATPLGAKVRAEAVLTRIEGRKLSFDIEVHDSFEKIAEGENERFIVALEKFRQKVETKHTLQQQKR